MTAALSAAALATVTDALAVALVAVTTALDVVTAVAETSQR